MTRKKELKEFYFDNKLIINCIVLAVLFFVNCFWGDMAYISFFVLGVFICTSDTKEGFSLLVSSIPFFCIKMSISMVLFGACAVIFILKAHIKMYLIDKKKLDKKTIILFVIFLAYALLPFGPYRVGFWVNFTATFGLLGLINIFTEYPETLRLRLNLNVLAMALLVATIYCLTYFISPYIHEKLVTLNVNEEYIRFAALFDNTLNLSRICELCLAMQLYFILSNKHNFTWVDYVSMVIYVMLGISTISKATLIIFTIMACILLVHTFRKYPFKTLMGLTLIAIVVLIVVFAFSDFIMTYAVRFVGEDFSDLDLEEKLNMITTDRWDLWVEYLTYMSHNPMVLIFGAGFGAKRIVELNPHNFYISLVYELGLVGAVLFVAVFICFLHNYVKKYPAKISKAIWVPIAILLLVMCVEDYFLCIY